VTIKRLLESSWLLWRLRVTLLGCVFLAGGRCSLQPKLPVPVIDSRSGLNFCYG
jgi:hypothetical protein